MLHNDYQLIWTKLEHANSHLLSIEMFIQAMRHLRSPLNQQFRHLRGHEIPIRFVRELTPPRDLHRWHTMKSVSGVQLSLHEVCHLHLRTRFPIFEPQTRLRIIETESKHIQTRVCLEAACNRPDYILSEWT
jgi:hypothetical protein